MSIDTHNHAPRQVLDVRVRIQASFRNPLGRTADGAISLYVTSAITAAFMLCVPAARHWFVLPVTACGALIGIDAVRWVRGEYKTFSPVGVVGAFGYHFFFLAPLLHVSLNQWVQYVSPPPDWRPWLGWMAAINAVGLVIYRCVIRRPRLQERTQESGVRVVGRSFGRAWSSAIVLAAAVEVYTLVRVGGLRGLAGSVTGATDLHGLGSLFALGESVPLLALLGLIVSKHLKRRPIAHVWLILVAFGAFQLALTGLRGSRGNLIYACVIGIGWMHLWAKRLSRKSLVFTAVLGLAFMYMYGFYKAEGFRGLEEALTNSGRTQLSQTYGRTVPSLLLEDLGRADVQAYELYRLNQPSASFSPADGRTYIGDVAILVPSSLIGERPPDKRKWGTELLFGNEAYASGFVAENIYGLAGEAMLNFGPVSVPVVFLIFALCVRRAQRYASRLAEGDARQLYVPMLSVLCVLLLTSDLDNVLYTALQFGLMTSLVLFLSSKPMDRDEGGKVNTVTTTQETALATAVRRYKRSQGAESGSTRSRRAPRRLGPSLE